MAERAFQVNDIVKLTNTANKDQVATILYIGPLQGKEEIWIGVELRLPNGNHNGTYNGVRYFEGKDNHCMFVRERHIQLVEQSNTPSPPKERQNDQPPPPPPQEKQEKPVEKKVLVKPTTTSTTGVKTGTSLGGVATAVKASKTLAEKSSVSSVKAPSSASNQASSSSAQSQQVNKQLEESISMKDSEINMLKENLENKDDLIQQYMVRTEELQNSNDFFQKQHSQLQEYNKILEEQVQKEQAKCQEATKEMLQSKEDYNKLKEDIDILSQAIKAAEESEALVEGLTIDKENLEHKLEELRETLSGKEQEIKKLMEEKQLAEIELEDAMKGVVPEGTEGSGDSANIDLMKANARLKQAIQLMNDQSEKEKIEMLEQIIELEGKLETLPEIELKSAEQEQKIEELLDEIKKKNDDIEELKERLDEQSEAVDMVENLTEQNQQLEDKITELKKEIKSFKEIKNVNDELFENYDLTIKDMQDQIYQLEYQIYEQKRLTQEKEEQINEQEKTIEKLKERTKIYKEQSENMKLEASENAFLQQNTEGKAGTSIQKLLEIQQELFSEKREIYRNYLDSQIQSINIKVESEKKNHLYLSCIPEVLQSKIYSDGIKVMINIQKNIKKTNLLHQELYSYLQRHTDQIIKEENLNLFLWVTQLLEQTNLFVFYSRRFETLILNSTSAEQLGNLAKSASNSSFVAGGVFIEMILKQLMEDNISPKVALDPILTANNKLKEEEFQAVPELEQTIAQAQLLKNIGHIRIQLICKLFLNKYINGQNGDILFNTLEKRILEFSKNLETGVILNSLKISKLIECNIALNTVFEAIQDEQIGSFFTPIKTELKGDIDTKEETDEQIAEREKIAQFRKIISDIANLLSSLNADADQKLQQGQINKQNDILTNNSYWNKTINEIKESIENIEITIQSEKRLSEELTSTKQKTVQQETEIDNLTKIKQTLEQRVVKLQFTSEKVTALENEKKRFQEKEKSFNEATELIQKELDNMKKKYRDSQEELKTLKSNPQIMRSSMPKNSTGPVLALKSSMSKNFGDTPKSGGSRQSIMFQQFDDDNCDLVRYYETENNMLRQKHLKDRIKNLVGESTNLKLFKKLKEKNNSENQISFLSQQINKATTVHNDGLQLLASKQVVDLSTLKEKNLSQKDQNIKEYLRNENKQLEALKYEAFKICNEVSKKVQKKPTSFKQRLDITSSNPSAPSELQNLRKIGSIQFNSESAQPCALTKLTISLNEWEKIREVF